MIHGGTRGSRTTPSCTSAQVRRTKVPLAIHRFRRGFGHWRVGWAKREAPSFTAPMGHSKHQSRPTRMKVKMMPAHQMVQVSFVARFRPATGVSANPRNTTTAKRKGSGARGAGGGGGGARGGGGAGGP